MQQDGSHFNYVFCHLTFLQAIWATLKSQLAQGSHSYTKTWVCAQIHCTGFALYLIIVNL